MAAQSKGPRSSSSAIVTLTGPGAVVLLYGYATGFRARVHEDVLLLDAGPFMESVLLRPRVEARRMAGHPHQAAGAPSSTPHKPVSIIIWL